MGASHRKLFAAYTYSALYTVSSSLIPTNTNPDLYCCIMCYYFVSLCVSAKHLIDCGDNVFICFFILSVLYGNYMMCIESDSSIFFSVAF